MSLTLVVATIGPRENQLRSLFRSIVEQPPGPIQTIVVDQNSHGRLDPVIDEFESVLNIVRLSASPGLSQARNVALPHIQGDVVAFPDDDCIYPPGTIAAAMSFLQANPQLHGVSGMAVTPQGTPHALRWRRAAGPIEKHLVWFQAISFSLFFRRQVIQRVGRFDETLGVGARTPWGAGEETDYVLRALQSGFRLAFEPSIQIVHPSVAERFVPANRRKAYSYALGMGRVLAKHEYPFFARLRLVALPSAGALLHAAGCDWNGARYYAGVAKGRLLGAASRFKWCEELALRTTKSGG